MRRILLMVLHNLLFVPFWFAQLCLYGRESDRHSEQERFALLKKITVNANKGGRVRIQSTGAENLPKKDGFILYPNHQGLFDVLAFVESCDHSFSVVMKKEVQNVPFLKQVFAVMRARAIDREDVRQAMSVILEVTKEVKQGRNYLIFAEGTRSKEGNKVQEFKGGSFKAAMKAKCPIVPVAVVDAYKPFDTHSTQPVTVQVHYLTPMYYDDYKEMKSTEIAALVKERIQHAINLNV
ncbi:MAG: lysophospholipid acyltransferase family protein [Lachnospiraceae bacterium]|jgi:1-acyl-sn-glycerol-3-phosphate acyltransferase|nr:lysophospholipid acyltransferase family protein [Lachnospiraceae bacterium]